MRPRPVVKSLKGRHAPVDLPLENRIEAARAKARDAKYKEIRIHARATTPEFRAGYTKTFGPEAPAEVRRPRRTRITFDREGRKSEQVSDY